MDILSSVFTHAVALSALAVVAVEQTLKLKLVPVTFANRYPVPTLIVLSLIAAIIVDLQGTLQPQSVLDWVLLVVTTAVTAAITYNSTLRYWDDLRAMETGTTTTVVKDPGL